MKVAIFTDVYAPWGSGGIVSSIQAQKLALEELGHEVVVFCPGKESELKKPDKSVFVVPAYNHWKVNGARVSVKPSRVVDYILEKYPDFKDFDIVHVHYEASCSIAGIRLAKKFDIPLVQTMHGREDMAIATNMPHPIKLLTAAVLNLGHSLTVPHEIAVRRDKFQAPSLTRALMWQIMVNHAEQADVVVTPADHLARKLEHYGVSRPIVIVPNGVPGSLVEREFAKRELEDGAVLKMLWNSRVSQEKRMLPFLVALKELKRPYMLYVYGGGNDLARAKKYAEKHQLKVKFFGQTDREKIIKRMQEAHLAVLTSYNFDVQPVSLVEAEATGLPVFFCDPTLCELVPMGSYVLADGPSSTAMSIALDRVQPGKVAEMSVTMLKGRKHVLIEAEIKKMLKAYNLAKKEHKARAWQKNATVF